MTENTSNSGKELKMAAFKYCLIVASMAVITSHSGAKDHSANNGYFYDELEKSYSSLNQTIESCEKQKLHFKKYDLIAKNLKKIDKDSKSELKIIMGKSLLNDFLCKSKSVYKAAFYFDLLDNKATPDSKEKNLINKFREELIMPSEREMALIEYYHQSNNSIKKSLDKHIGSATFDGIHAFYPIVTQINLSLVNIRSPSQR